MTSHALLLDEPLLTYQPALVRRIGLAEAAIVQQLQFWSRHATMVHDGHAWVYKTYADWANEIGLSTKAIRGATDRLRKTGLVVAIQSPLDPRDRTLWWRIDYRMLDDDEEGSPSAPEGSPTAAQGSSRARVPPGPSDPTGIGNSTEITTEKTARERADASSRADTVRDLFAYWQQTCGHLSARPTRERTSKIKARLKDGYTPDQIRTAIDGAARAPFVADNGKRFDDLELICRTGAKLEDFIERAALPAPGDATNVRQLKPRTVSELKYLDKREQEQRGIDALERVMSAHRTARNPSDIEGEATEI